MKDLIALLAFICFSITTIYLSVNKLIDLKLTIALLCFSIISGITIANYDLIKKFKWGNVEVETAKREIIGVKETALKEISSEVKDQKESIKLLISNANDTRDKIERQKESLTELIKTATDLQKKIEEQKKIVVALNQSAEKTKSDIEKLNAASSQIALTVIRATYLSMETKSEFGTERAQKAIQEVLNDLNRILPMVITDEKERSEWIRKLQNTLPPRK
jgi:methyl-accepting chemotaxis protein